MGQETTGQIPEVLQRRAGSYELLSRSEFLDDFRQEAERATDIVILETFVLEPDDAGKELQDIYRCIKPGVRKVLIVDWYSKLVDEDEPRSMNLSARDRAERKAKKDAFYQELQDEGVELVFTNPPENWITEKLPVIGRNHMKYAEVDRKNVWINGFNITNGEEFYGDFGMKFTGDIAENISVQFERIMTGECNEDFEVVVESGDGFTTSLMFDTGKRGKSLIYENASVLIDGARTSVKNVAYIYPDKRWGDRLKKAKDRGVHTEVLNHAPYFDFDKLFSVNNAWWFQNWINWGRNSSKFNHMPRLMNPYRALHSKLLIIDDRVAIFGSHNFNYKGVQAGTREIGIKTNDPRIVGKLITAYYDLRSECFLEGTVL